jgi:hypothetical protein
MLSVYERRAQNAYYNELHEEEPVEFTNFTHNISDDFLGVLGKVFC